MKILVTGGAGFVGSHLVDALSGKHEVIIYDNLEPQVHKNIPEYLNNSSKFIKEDICDRAKLKDAIVDSEVVFHEAAMVGVGQSMYQIEKYMDVNTMGTAKLLDILVNEEHDVKKLIVASSMSIYGEGKYECSDCGDVYPSLRSETQLKKQEWELKCPRYQRLRPLSGDTTERSLNGFQSVEALVTWHSRELYEMKFNSQITPQNMGSA